MRFNASQTKDFIPKIAIENYTLQVVRQSKILGITLKDSLKWDSHVSNICNKARKKIWILRRMMNVGLSYELILDVYIKEVRSTLEDNSVIFHSGLTAKLPGKIENLQRNVLYNFSSYLGSKLSYSEARILYDKSALCKYCSMFAYYSCHVFSKRRDTKPLSDRQMLFHPGVTLI